METSYLIGHHQQHHQINQISISSSNTTGASGVILSDVAGNTASSLAASSSISNNLNQSLLYHQLSQLESIDSLLSNLSSGSNVDAELADGSASLLVSFLRQIDKQWSVAELILIIIMSTILNLVTIVGNIMVLISFKMDRS